MRRLTDAICKYWKDRGIRAKSPRLSRFVLIAGATNTPSPIKVCIVIDGLSDDIDLHVYDENGNETLASSETSGATSEDVILDLQPGRYVVAADFYGSNHSDYRLSIFSIQEGFN